MIGNNTIVFTVTWCKFSPHPLYPVTLNYIVNSKYLEIVEESWMASDSSKIYQVQVNSPLKAHLLVHTLVLSKWRLWRHVGSHQHPSLPSKDDEKVWPRTSSLRTPWCLQDPVICFLLFSFCYQSSTPWPWLLLGWTSSPTFYCWRGRGELWKPQIFYICFKWHQSLIQTRGRVLAVLFPQVDTWCLQIFQIKWCPVQ